MYCSAHIFCSQFLIIILLCLKSNAINRASFGDVTLFSITRYPIFDGLKVILPIASTFCIHLLHYPAAVYDCLA